MKRLVVLLLFCGTGFAFAQPSPPPRATPRPHISPSPLGSPKPGEMRFKGMDRNQDGRISRDEWRGNDRSFEKKDTNGDGVLSGDEVRPAAVRSPGAPPSPSPRPGT